jgi:Fe-S-cluster containining protein
VKFRRDYVLSSRQRRRGECRRCGTCCRVFAKCTFLSGNTCRIYGIRFDQCRAFPIDTSDIELVRDMGGECGFWFEEGEN